MGREVFQNWKDYIWSSFFTKFDETIKKTIDSDSVPIWQTDDKMDVWFDPKIPDIGAKFSNMA